jgi:type IV secretory pathway VirJ component
MKFRFLCHSVLLVLLLSVNTLAQAQKRGENSVAIREKEQRTYYYPAVGSRLNRKVLFVPGDGGWRGFAIVVAERMASWGYDVYGLDTSNYLESFTHKDDHLREADVMSDFR